VSGSPIPIVVNPPPTQNSLAFATQSKSEGEKYLESLSVRGMDLALDRIRRLLGHLQNPQNSLPYIHVTGTNGKGSVCAYLSSILHTSGLRVGIFSSPHLRYWRESILLSKPIGGVEPIEPKEFDEALEIVRQCSEQNAVALTQFEALTSSAFVAMNRAKVDVAIIEVGLGGKDDATNVCDGTNLIASVLVSVGWDHTLQLGPTLSHIAWNKVGIARVAYFGGFLRWIFSFFPDLQFIGQRGRPLVCGPLEKEPKREVVNYSKELGFDVIFIGGQGEGQLPSSELKEFEWTDRLNSSDTVAIPLTELPLPGDHQRINATISLTVLRIMKYVALPAYWYKDSTNLLASLVRQMRPTWDEAISLRSVRRGMHRVEWGARLQTIRWKGHEVLLDGAHNVSAANVLCPFVRSQRLQLSHGQARPVHWIIGMLGTKDHRAFLAALDIRPGDRVWCVPVVPNVTWLTSAPPDKIAQLVASLPHLSDPTSPVDIRYFPSVFAALDSTVALLNSTKASEFRPVVVLTGSLVMSTVLFWSSN